MSEPNLSNGAGASHQPKRLTTWEKLGHSARMLWAVPLILSRTLQEVLSQHAFQGRIFKMILLRNAAKVLGSISPLPVSQALDPTTGATVAKFCAAHHVPSQSTPLHPKDFAPATLHTLVADDSRSHGVLLYFHGGGYIRAASSGMVQLALLIAKTLGCRHLAFLEYTLAPGGRYPTQLAQGAAALQLLLETHRPLDIFLGGDSAGGNLALGLLAHLREAHPDVTPIGGSPVLAGTLCISPRCCNDTTAASFVANGPKDVLDANGVLSFLALWAPKNEVWAESNVGGREFWAGPGALKTEKILIMAGANECYVDDIRGFADMVGAEEVDSVADAVDRQLVVVRDAMHDQAMLDYMIGIDDGTMTVAILRWAQLNVLRS